MEKKSLLIKILIPVLIIAVLVGMWLVKNRQDPSEESATTQSSQTETDLPEELKDANFELRETEAIDFEGMASYGIPMIVDYGADTCISCKEMAPVLEKANEEYRGKAFIKFINVWIIPMPQTMFPYRSFQPRSSSMRTERLSSPVKNWPPKSNF